STVNYTGGNSVAANTYDLWINDVLVGDNLAKGQLGAATDINAFRFYGESSAGNVATIALDNIVWYNTCVLPVTSEDPTLIATPPAISNLNYVEGNGPSASQSFELSASN